MGTKNNLLKILSSVKVPILAHFDADEGITNQTSIAKLQCSQCNAEVLSNTTILPLCPCCSNTMKVISKAKIYSKPQLEAFHKLGHCESCNASYVSNEETIESLDGKSFNCVLCAESVKADSDEDSDEKVSQKDVDPSLNKNSDNTGDDDNKSADNDTSKDSEPAKVDTEAETELKDTLKKLGIGKSDEDDKDSDDDNKDGDTESKKDSDDKPAEKVKKTEKTESKSDPDDEDDGEEDDEENDDEEDDEEMEAAASAAIFRSKLKSSKDISLIASRGYNNWFMFADNFPLAVASYKDADESIKRVFRSDQYTTAFEAAVATDGGVNDQLIKDFGFSPINIDVKLDDVSKQLIKDQVEEKTKDLDEKLKSLSETFDQCIGISSIGIAKGFYDKGGKFRENLVSKLVSLNVREPEVFVDNFLAKELPDLMKSVVVNANELMTRSADSLEATASLVMEAAPRAIPNASKRTNTNVFPLSLTASVPQNTQKDNLENKKAPSGKELGASIVSRFKSV